jgi:uncharacterized protein (TIGR03437 family)
LYVGRIQLTSAFGTQNITVSELVTPTPAQLVIKDGNDGKGLPGDSLPPLQVAVFDDAGNPLSGVPVTFTFAAGAGTLNDREVTTNASGVASVVLTLPSKPGTVQIIASVDTLSVTFTETALAAPIFTTDSVFDAVTFNANTSFGPGSILAILGQNLATTTALAPGALPISLASTQVLLTTPSGDVALPLFAVSPTQITALLPLDATPGRYHLHVSVDSIRSDDIEIAIAGFDPGIFTANGSGRGPGIFLKDNGSIVSASNPADRGSRVSFYAAGLGAVTPSIPAGAVAAASEPLNRTVQLPRVFFDRFGATVLYSGLAPCQAGRYLVTVQVPASVSPATNVSVSLTMGGFTSNRVTIPVR